MMSGLALFRVTNRATIEASLGHDMAEPAELERQIETFTSMVLAWLATPELLDVSFERAEIEELSERDAG